MPTQLLDLPAEILISVLYSLDLPALAACLATNRRVKSIIDGSTLLQYRRAAQAACVEDNPWNTSLTSAQKLTALQKRQTAFKELHPSSVRTIALDNFSFGRVYALSGGLFAVTEEDGRVLRWTSLAETEPVWRRLEIEEPILELALAVPEEDLLVILSASLPTTGSLNLRFYEMSTQSPHRMAREPVIRLPICGVNPGVVVDICGTKSALLVDYTDAEVTTYPNRLVVYDWKQGSLLLDLDAKYTTATFISSDVLLGIREDPGTFELWNIHKGGSDGPEIFLELPPLITNGISNIAKVEHNPKGPTSRNPFNPAFADSILLLHVFIYLDGRGEDEFYDMFLVISRRGLLQLLPPTGGGGKTLSWGEWGPPIARWINGNTLGIHDWQTTSCGQRCAFVTNTGSVRLYDFNPYTYRQQEKAERACTGPFSTRVDVSGDEENVAPGVFDDQDMVSRLGYVVSEAQASYKGVLVDEEWIVAMNDMIQTDGPGKFTFEVWHLS
ncbi:hypothetical protein C8R46DRAFT_1208705 [Mycena filopes]|nr:hypothetical protein C8R46DRAFT_1208705 [Mycena filopes]